MKVRQCKRCWCITAGGYLLHQCHLQKSIVSTMHLTVNCSHIVKTLKILSVWLMKANYYYKPEMTSPEYAHTGMLFEERGLAYLLQLCRARPTRSIHTAIQPRLSHEQCERISCCETLHAHDLFYFHAYPFVVKILDMQAKGI